MIAAPPILVSLQIGLHRCDPEAKANIFMCRLCRQRHSAIIELLWRKIVGVPSILISLPHGLHRCDPHAKANISMCRSCRQRDSAIIAFLCRKIIGVPSILVSRQNGLQRCDPEAKAEISKCISDAPTPLWHRNPIAPNIHRPHTNQASKNSSLHFWAIHVDDKCKRQRFD